MPVVTSSTLPNLSAAPDPFPETQAAAPPAERERQVKLGLLLVRLGAASEQSVFGPRGIGGFSPPRDLLVIHRREDDADTRRPFRWYDPISWFTSGSRPSPITWSSSSEGKNVDLVSPIAPTQSLSKENMSPGVKSTEKKTRRRARGLPPVNMAPIKDDSTLELSVREERAKLMRADEAVHRALDRIEDTRYTYLVPSQELRCEAEVLAVLQCYERHNGEGRNSSSENRTTGIEVNDFIAPLPDVLQCAPVVNMLRKCAVSVAEAYSRADQTSPK